MAVAPMAPVAAARRARRRVRRAFEDAEAFSPDRAIGFEPQRRLERKWLDGMLAVGGLVEARPGAYWMDREKYAAEESRWRKRALTMMGAAIGAVVVMFGISQL